MSTKFFTALAKGDDSYTAGRAAAEKVMKKLQGEKPSLTVVFASSFYDY